MEDDFLNVVGEPVEKGGGLLRQRAGHSSMLPRSRTP
jgi:hypothetical protein